MNKFIQQMDEKKKTTFSFRTKYTIYVFKKTKKQKTYIYTKFIRSKL